MQQTKTNQEISQFNETAPNEWEEKLVGELTKPGMDLYAEAALMKWGILSILERAGIVPQVSNPNPYDPEKEAVLHDKWWRNHPQQAKIFRQKVEQREKSLQQLYIGKRLNSL